MTASDKSEKFASLRQQAEDFFRHSLPVDSATHKDLSEIIHELNIYQTELEIQNQELQRSQYEYSQLHKEYSDLYEFAPCGYLTINSKGIVTRANLRAVTMLGATKTEIIHSGLSSFIAPGYEDSYYHSIARARETAESQSIELSLKHKRGIFWWARIDIEADFEENKDLRQWRITIMDITSQKQAEEKIRHAKKDWENTFDAIIDIITIQDQDMHILRANKATCLFFETEYEDIIGQKCHKLFRGSPDPCPECPVLETLADQGSHNEIITNETLNKTFMITSSLLSDDTGGHFKIIHVAKDISNQIKNEEKIRQAQRMQAVGTLAGGIAHEFNNMLGVIMGCADLARDDVPKDSFARTQLDKIMKASYRTKDLIQQILLYSRQSQKKCTPLQLKPIIKEAIRFIKSSLPSSIEVNSVFSREDHKVNIDPTEVQQILMNLCANASWAMEENGVITITLSLSVLPEDDLSLKKLIPSGDYMKITFTDTGCGMDKGVMNRVFDSFYTTKDAGQGTGMGLAIVRAIMEGYKGTVKVESEVGKGSTFQLYFPVSEKPVIERPEPGEEISKGSERILFVDDEKMYAEMGYYLITQLGYNVDPQIDSMKALAVFKAKPNDYDLIITDQVMPNLSGEELVKEIRSIRADMPVIICTGYSTQMDEKKAGLLGINAFAYKPMVKKDIAKLIRNVLDRGDVSIFKSHQMNKYIT